MKNKLFVLLLVLILTSCAQGPAPSVIDREGNPITLPDKIDTIISFGPSNTEILIALGLADSIIAADTYSVGIPGLAADIPLFDMLSPDGERIAALAPDIVFVTSMSKFGNEDPFGIVSSAGICIIYIPSAAAITDIIEDIRYIAAITDKTEAGDLIINELEQELDAIRAVGDTITDKSTVYFEIEAAPWMYSFGSGVFLNEMIEIIGAVNIFGGEDEWIAVADEAIVELNPDVILTSVNYLIDPVAEIMERPGWNGITAVANKNVYYIDTDSCNRPSHHIVKALREMAAAVYPDLYGEQ